MPKYHGKKKGKKVSDGAESREEKLLRLAGKRVPKAIKAIALVGNLGNYKPSEKQAKKIIAHFQKAVATLESRLLGSATSDEGFSLEG